MWENAYYGPGRDDGVMQTRRRADRLRQRLRVGALAAPPRGCAAASGCWPAACASRRSRPGARRSRCFWDREHATMLEFARESPGRHGARARGAAVHPSHVGDVVMETPLMPRRPVADDHARRDDDHRRDGAILERLAYEDGEGYVAPTSAGASRSRSTRSRRASG